MRSRSILLVEDDEGFRAFVSRRLRGKGFIVELASSGESALELLRAQWFDLVLLDYKLPDVRADEFVRANWQQLNNPPFMVLTGYGDERTAVQLMKLGAEDYIVKDSDFLDHLETAVERTMRHLEQERLLHAAEERLRQSEERLSLALNASGIGVWDIDLGAGPAIVCERWMAIAARIYPNAPIPLDELHGAVHPDDLELVTRRWKVFVSHATLPNANFDATYRVTQPTGEIRWVHDHGVLVRQTSDHAPLRVIRTLNDITPRMKLRSMKEQMRRAQKMETLGTLAGGIAHDFNNVLAGIVGFTELSLRHAEDAVRVRSNCGRVLQASQRARDVIRQVMLFSRQSPPQKTAVDLVSLVKEYADLVRAAIAPNIAICIRNEISEAIVDADASQLGQVIANLLNNAAQAIGERDGSITISVRRVQGDKPVGVGDSLTDFEGFFAIGVKDNGPGIPHELQERIFEPFFSTRETPGEGAGLGLATSQGIITSHGGRLLVASREGEGATFTVLLAPAGSEAQVIDAKTPHKEDAAQGAARILFVDDEPLLAEATTMLLQETGYEVVSFADPTEALAHYRTHVGEYDLAICDYSMPRMNGLDLIREIHAESAGLPAILITGNLDPKALASEGALEGVRLLHKPYSLGELLDAISESTPMPAG
ncbi:MAG: response regulator [Puniceicoccales bacterium]